jgi:CheY-like chemotaxis protein
MVNAGPIIIIEDDIDDQEIIREAFEYLEVRNELKFFNTCDEALEYLINTSDHPFLIFCDVNLPGMSGTEFRNKINNNEYLQEKNIPFIFLTTSSDKGMISQAFRLLAQGYFVKPSSIDGIRAMIRMIIDYWMTSKHPNSNYNRT